MSTKKAAVLMRVNIGGYAGPPASVFAAFDPGTDVLAVVRQATDYDAGPNAALLKISNQDRDANFDAIFAEEHIRAAITTFFELDALKLISISEKAQRCNPLNKIERDGMDDKGMKYRIAPDITNGQVAVLAAAHFAGVQRGASAAHDFEAELRMMSI